MDEITKKDIKDEITKRIPSSQNPTLIGEHWVQNRYPISSFKNDGWKLHISGTPENGSQILDIVLPILNEDGVVYKFVISTKVLKIFDNMIQKGKLMTIYPETEKELVELAWKLDKALAGKGLKAPHILTDRVLPKGKSNLVYYRNVSKEDTGDRVSGIYNLPQETDPFTGETFKEIPEEEFGEMKMLKLKDLPAEELPTMGSMYGSKNPITELLELIDTVIQYKPVRCDCDSYTRCRHCIMKTEFAYKRESLKKEVIRIFERE